MRCRHRTRRDVGLVLALAIFAACGGPAAAPPEPAPKPTPSPAAAATPRVAVEPTLTGDDRPTVIFLGDSLTAGLGLEVEQAFPAFVAAELARRGLPIRLVNAGVSGDTTAGGLARLDWLLRQRPDVLVVGLGANDGLRGLDLAASERNLREIVIAAKAAGARVLLLGMLIPPNYGPDYGNRFAALFPRLAREQQVPLVPFLLQGVAAVGELNQADGIHPTAEGQRRVAANVLPQLEPLVRAAAAARAAAPAATR